MSERCHKVVTTWAFLDALSDPDEEGDSYLGVTQGRRKSVLKKLVDERKLVEEVDREKLSEYCDAVTLEPMDAIVGRRVIRVGGEVRAVRIVPRRVPVLKVTVLHRRPRSVVGVFLGRRKVVGTSPGRKVALAGVAAKSGNRFVLVNLMYQSLKLSLAAGENPADLVFALGRHDREHFVARFEIVSPRGMTNALSRTIVQIVVFRGTSMSLIVVVDRRGVVGERDLDEPCPTAFELQDRTRRPTVTASLTSAVIRCGVDTEMSTPQFSLNSHSFLAGPRGDHARGTVENSVFASSEITRLSSSSPVAATIIAALRPASRRELTSQASAMCHSMPSLMAWSMTAGFCSMRIPRDPPRAGRWR